METAIEAKDVVIRYRTFKKVSIKKALRNIGQKKTEYYEAVRGVSFTLEKGKILGIVGKNGSGKSTLLRAIANIYAPDSGSINTFNNTVSLLALGVGFSKELTGRENIILSGMLLGFSEEHIMNKMKDIIKFAELGEFIDKPVNTYSSGMHSKLSFAITCTLETDIILIDEVLSVGDIKFRKKSHEKLLELINNKDRTVVIVSHNARQLKKLCDEALWIDSGKVVMHGEAKKVVDAYEAKMRESGIKENPGRKRKKRRKRRNKKQLQELS